MKKKVRLPKLPKSPKSLKPSPKKSKSSRFRWSIRNQLILAFALILLGPSLVIGANMYAKAKEQVQDSLIASANQSIETANLFISNAINTKMHDAEYLSGIFDSSMIDGRLSPNIVPKLAQYLGEHPEAIDAFIGTPDGTMIRGVPKENENGYDPRERDWYKLAEASPGQTIITPVVINSNKLPVVVIAHSLPDNSGVLGISLNLEIISKLADIDVGTEGYVVILDADKNYIVTRNGTTGEAASGEYLNTMYAQDHGEMNYTFENQSKKMVFLTNKETGWKIAGTMYTSEIDTAVQPIRNQAMLIIIISIVVAGVIVAFCINMIMKPLLGLRKTTQQISDGDLTIQIDESKNNEIGDLAHDFAIMVSSLREMIENVRDTTDNVSSASEQLAAGAEETSRSVEHVTLAIQEVSTGSERQVAGVEVGADAIHRMSERVAEISGHVTEVSQSMSDAATASAKGNESIIHVTQQIFEIQLTVDRLSEVIGSLHTQSSEIGGIVDLIRNIAKQTNLLALNASIEAARAGEHGKGFAVVADEVRKLASESGESAERIGSLITGMQGIVAQSLEVMDQAKENVTGGILAVDTSGRSFSKINRAIKAVSRKMDDVTGTTNHLNSDADAVVEAIEDIASISEQAASNTETISAAAEEQLASMQEVSSAATDLTRLAEQLQQLVSRFKV